MQFPIIIKLTEKEVNSLIVQEVLRKLDIKDNKSHSWNIHYTATKNNELFTEVTIKD